MGTRKASWARYIVTVERALSEELVKHPHFAVGHVIEEESCVQFTKILPKMQGLKTLTPKPGLDL